VRLWQGGCATKRSVLFRTAPPSFFFQKFFLKSPTYCTVTHLLFFDPKGEATGPRWVLPSSHSSWLFLALPPPHSKVSRYCFSQFSHPKKICTSFPFSLTWKTKFLFKFQKNGCVFFQLSCTHIPFHFPRMLFRLFDGTPSTLHFFTQIALNVSNSGEFLCLMRIVFAFRTIK
jgi:hypothetical protein